MTRPANLPSALAYGAVAIACLHPAVPVALALALGCVMALTLGNPFIARTKPLSSKLLGLSIVGIGAQLDVMAIAKVGSHGVGITFFGIMAILGLGVFLGQRLSVSRNLTVLISFGTAICGGSAMAAVTPVLKAESHEVTVAMATVFLLNALALVIFPPLGAALHLSEPQFGVWAALAIHDTSSVVGAALQYGKEALAVGTTVKLVRACWIVPFVFLIGAILKRMEPEGASTHRARVPWFIPGFLVAAGLVTWLPVLRPVGDVLGMAGKRGLVLALFLIGSGLSRNALQTVGVRPLLLGALLWLVTACVALGLVKAGIVGI